MRVWWIGVWIAACGAEPDREDGAASGCDQTITEEACVADGGQLLYDPGDGSLHEAGCPDARACLGFVELGREGGLCCD